MMIWKENFQSKPWNRGKSFFSPPRRGSTHLTLATHLRMVLAHYLAQFWMKTITKNYENTQKSRTEVNSAVRMDDYERGCSLNSRFPQSQKWSAERETWERHSKERETDGCNSLLIFYGIKWALFWWIDLWIISGVSYLSGYRHIKIHVNANGSFVFYSCAEGILKNAREKSASANHLIINKGASNADLIQNSHYCRLNSHFWWDPDVTG